MQRSFHSVTLHVRFNYKMETEKTSKNGRTTAASSVAFDGEALTVGRRASAGEGLQQGSGCAPWRTMDRWRRIRGRYSWSYFFRWNQSLFPCLITPRVNTHSLTAWWSQQSPLPMHPLPQPVGCLLPSIEGTLTYI